MKTEVYTCDICKQSKSKDDLCSMDITTRGVTFTQNKFAPPSHFDICKDCLRKQGFAIEIRKQEDATATDAQNKKTLETKLFDILEDLGVAFVD